MKKYLIIIFTFLPILSFAQLTNEEKSTIDNYAVNICDCINEVIETLGVKTNEILTVFANEGEDIALKQIEEYLTTASEEDTKKLLASFDQMSKPEFGNKIEQCDNKDGMPSEIIFSIDNEKGKYSDYFYNYLTNTLECKITNYLMVLGNQVEENEE